MNTLDRITSLVMFCLLSFLLGCFITIKCERPQETKDDTTVIDSLTKVNDSIKIKVERLDSIKDAKVIEVVSLDNDSTLKLFYKLVKE